MLLAIVILAIAVLIAIFVPSSRKKPAVQEENPAVMDYGLNIPARLLITDDPYTKHEVIGSYHLGDYWGALWRHTLTSGRVYEEAVHFLSTSAPPMIFLALKAENGDWVPESLWSREAPEWSRIINRSNSKQD